VNVEGFGRRRAAITAILQDGIERIFKVVKGDPFTFFVSGEEFASTVPGAIAISLNIHKSLLSNPLIDRFEFAKGAIETEDFRFFLELARLRGPYSLYTFECSHFSRFGAISGVSGRPLPCLLRWIHHRVAVRRLPARSPMRRLTNARGLPSVFGR
jgi:hypothetical protein